MKRTSSPWILGAGVVAVAAGCAQSPLKVDASTVNVAPVYRTSTPVGTAAGQYAVGRIDLSEGRFDAAIKRFRQALELEPAYVDAHNGLGVAYGQQGRFIEAEAAFRAALALAPDSPHLLNNLGFAQMRAGRLDDAWIALKRSIELEAHNAQTRENLKQLAELRRAAAVLAEARAAEAVAAVGATATTVDTRTAQVGAAAATAAPKAAATTTPVAAPSVVALPTPNASPVPAVAQAPIVAQAPVVTAAPFVQQSPQATPPRSTIVQLAPHLYELRYPEGQAAPSVSQVQPMQHSQVPPAPIEAQTARAEPTAARRDAPVAAIGLPPDPMPRPIDLPRRFAATTGTLATMAINGVEVSNGVGIRHLAGRTARKLAQLGVTVQRISDYQAFGRQRSEIHYRTGHLASAQAMQRSLPVDVRLVKSSRLHEGVNLRLVVGRDLVARPIAWLDDVDDVPATVAAGATPVASGAGLGASNLVAVEKVAGTNRFEGWRLL